MKRIDKVEILRRLGYGHDDISKIVRFKFEFEMHPGADHRLEISCEHAARLCRIFKEDSFGARILYDFVDGYRGSLEKWLSSAEVIEELENDREYWHKILKETLKIKNY